MPLRTQRRRSSFERPLSYQMATEEADSFEDYLTSARVLGTSYPSNFSSHARTLSHPTATTASLEIPKGSHLTHRASMPPSLQLLQVSRRGERGARGGEEGRKGGGRGEGRRKGRGGGREGRDGGGVASCTWKEEMSLGTREGQKRGEKGQGRSPFRICLACFNSHCPTRASCSKHLSSCWKQMNLDVTI